MIDQKTPPATASLYSQLGSRLVIEKTVTGEINEVIRAVVKWHENGGLDTQNPAGIDLLEKITRVEPDESEMQ